MGDFYDACMLSEPDADLEPPSLEAAFRADDPNSSWTHFELMVLRLTSSDFYTQTIVLFLHYSWACKCVLCNEVNFA